jgi:hypothetical protein
MSCCMFLDLPEELFRTIMIEWIAFNNVVRLDTAVCSRDSRNLFLALAFGDFAVYTVDTYLQNRRFETMLSWAIQRNARLAGLRVCEAYRCDSQILQMFLKMSGAAVCWMETSICEENGFRFYQALQNIARWCPNVKKLELHMNLPTSLCDNCFATLAQSFENVASLTIDAKQISKQGFAVGLNYFNRLENLEVVSSNQDLPTGMALPTLKSISTNYMTDAVLRAIGQRCAQLESLRMFGRSQPVGKSPVTDVGVRAVLEGCPLLRDTDVKYALGISIELRMELVRRRRLTTLRACEWPIVDDTLAQEMLKVSPDLRCIDFERATWVTDATLVVVAQHCRLLESITVGGCTQLTDAGVCALIAKVGSTLLSISVGCCYLLTDESVLAIARSCPNLVSVFCPPNASDAAVAKLAEGCPNLVHANLADTGVRDGGLVALSTYCVKLVTLNLMHCPNITKKGVRAVAQRCTCLETVWLPAQLRRELAPEFASTNVKVLYMACFF